MLFKAAAGDEEEPEFQPPAGEAEAPHETGGELAERASQVITSRLREPKVTFQVEINGVGLDLQAVAVDRSEGAICCILRDNDLKCRLPVSDNVLVRFGAEEVKATYVGGWHRFESLGIQVLAFADVQPVDD